jgi:hypothetical protein
MRELNNLDKESDNPVVQAVRMGDFPLYQSLLHQGLTFSDGGEPTPVPLLEQEEPESDVEVDIITTALIQSLIRTGGSTTEPGVIAIINSLMDDHAVRPSLFGLALSLIFENAEQLQEKLFLSISDEIVNLMESGSVYVVLSHLIGAVLAAEENVKIESHPLTLSRFKDRLVNIIEYDNLEVLSEIDAMIDACEGELILALEDEKWDEYCNDVFGPCIHNSLQEFSSESGDYSLCFDLPSKEDFRIGGHDALSEDVYDSLIGMVIETFEEAYWIGHVECPAEWPDGASEILTQHDPSIFIEEFLEIEFWDYLGGELPEDIPVAFLGAWKVTTSGKSISFKWATPYWYPVKGRWKIPDKALLHILSSALFRATNPDELDED